MLSALQIPTPYFSVKSMPRPLAGRHNQSGVINLVVDQVNQFICQKALDSGMNVGLRLSPGYGKWLLTDQRIIFGLLPGENIGVYLTDRCMMIPQKSVSFCTGLGIQESLRDLNPCRYCGMPNCQYRKVK